MKKRDNKECIVCGKKYTFCTGCEEFDHLPRWMAIYHDENCKEIFEISTDFNAGDLSKEEAKERLDKCNLSNKKSFHKAIVKAIDEINAANEKKVNEVKSNITEETDFEKTKKISFK